MSEIRTKTKTTVHLLTWKRPNYFGFSDEGVDSSISYLQLGEDAWTDMGCPSTLTVTLEVGDKLNEEDS